MQCPTCGTDIAEATSCPNCAASTRPRTRRSNNLAGVLAIVLLLAAAGGVAFWYWNKRNSPKVAVEKLMQAARNRDWKQIYDLVAWQDPQKKIDERTFVTLASAISSNYTLEDYKIGEAKTDGDTATVPVTVTATVKGLFGAGTKRTDSADVRCRWVSGDWKIEPFVKLGFLGFGAPNLSGGK